MLAERRPELPARRARPRSSWTRATPRSWRWPNWPSVDPSDPSGSRPEALRNLATGFTYEPGSTFKAFTVAGALVGAPGHAEHDVQPADRDSRWPTATISDAEDRGTETLTVAQILAQSSNVGAVKIGPAKLGAERFDRWVRRFGFGDPTGIDFPGEERGIVLDLSEYSGSTIGNLPIGQGLSVTPMQMAAGYAAIANGGVLRPPRLILEEGGDARRCAARPPCDQHGDGRGRLRRCSRACWRPAAPRRRSACPATRLPARREPRRWPSTAATRRRSSSPRSSASPRPATRGCWSRWWSTSPQGNYYGGDGRRPGVRRDRRVRAPIPGDPARPAAIESPAMKLRELLVERGGRRDRRRREVEIAGLRTTVAGRARARSSSAFRGSAPTATISRRWRRRARRRRARRRAAPGPGGAPGAGRRRPRGDGARSRFASGAIPPRSWTWSASPAPTGRRPRPS